MQALNWIDYGVIAIFILSVTAGLLRGLFKELISLITLIAAFVVATLFASNLAGAITQTDTVQSMVNQANAAPEPVTYVALGISFAVLFVGTMIIGAIIGMIINLILKGTVLGFGNRMMGGIFGLGRGFLINLVLIFLVQLTSFSTADAWTNSQLVTYFQPAVQWIASKVSPDLENLKEKVADKLNGKKAT